MNIIQKALEEAAAVEAAKITKTSSGCISPSLDEFFNLFLNEKFPEGELNKTIEKNFAIYLYQNKLDWEKAVKTYEERGWKHDGLIGWLKKAGDENLVLNIKELLGWANEFDIEKKYIPLLERAKLELEIFENWKLMSDKQLDSYEGEKTSWIVDKFIKEGGVHIIGGKKRVTKSWFALDLAFCIASGQKLFGQFECQQGNILYLDRENGWIELKIRKNMLKKGLDIKNPQNIHFFSENTLKLDNPIHLKLIEQIIIRNNIKVVIGDTYRRLISFDENSAGDVSKFFVDMLKPLCERTKAAFVLLHHEKKGETQGDEIDLLRGSSDFANYVDCIFQLEKKGNKILIKNTANRSAKELEPFSVEIITDEATSFKFNYLGVVQNKENETAQFVTDWIISEKKQSFRYTDAMTYCESHGYKKNAVNNALKQLEGEGFLKKDSLKAPYVVNQDKIKFNLNDYG